ncbi:ubiquitinyl hydrolase 1 [Malassezia sp. CBS 17886]|nr:ubiquitinyl hydrolase 1 [Malassezia sp. CBS 17886]
MRLRGHTAPLQAEQGSGLAGHVLTSPTNQVSFLGGAGLRAAPAAPTAPVPATPAELDARARTFRDEIRFSAHIPVAHWMRIADTLKRQADQHHSADDLERQYLCLLKCAILLTELLPQEHPGFARLDAAVRERVRRNGDAICGLVALTREALVDARDDALGVAQRARAPMSPSRTKHHPGRSSLRGSPAKEGTAALFHTPGPKHVSFAVDTPSRASSSSRLSDLFRWPSRGAAARWGPPDADASPLRSGQVSPPLEHPGRLRKAGPAAAQGPLFPTAGHGAVEKAAAAGSQDKGTRHEIRLGTNDDSRLGTHDKRRALPSSSHVARDMHALHPATSSPLRSASARDARRPAEASTSPVTPPHPAPRSAPATNPSQQAEPSTSAFPPPHPAEPSTSQVLFTSSPLEPFTHSHVPLARQMRGCSVSGMKAAGDADAARTATGAWRAAETGERRAEPGERRTADTRDSAARPPPGNKGRRAPAGIRRSDTTGGAAACAPQPVRPVYLPRAAITQFLALAAANTEANTETCALLLGTERDGRLCVTHLVAPPQTGTGHSCAADGEEDVLAFQLAHDIDVLGWIHTHPSQSCFLSSLDLHTQAGYQTLLPEAFAVVCAPQHDPSLGIFRLRSRALRYILACRDPEPFHTHEDDDDGASLYADVLEARARGGLCGRGTHDAAAQEQPRGAIAWGGRMGRPRGGFVSRT